MGLFVRKTKRMFVDVTVKIPLTHWSVLDDMAKAHRANLEDFVAEMIAEKIRLDLYEIMYGEERQKCKLEKEEATKRLREHLKSVLPFLIDLVVK